MAMKYDIDGHIWWAPTPKPFGRVLHKDSPSTPATPDPAVVSAAQTKSNVDTAAANAQLNRVNQFTPYGNLTYTKRAGESTFDQAGYDKALADYNAAQPQGQGAPIYGDDTGTVTGYNPTTPVGTAPDRNAFTKAGVDEWDARITLDPAQQRLLDQDNAIKEQMGNLASSGFARVSDTMGQPLDTSNMTGYRDIPQGGGVPQGGGAQRFTAPDANYATSVQGGNIQTSLPNSDYANQRTSVEDAIYSRVNPQLQRDRNALDVKLSNQGIMPGSEAYNEAIDESNRQANDARYQAVLAGGQEQSRLAGLDLAAGNFANAAQNQGFGQNLTNATLQNSVNDTMFNQGLMSVNQNNAANQQDFSQQMASNQQGFSQQIEAARQAAQQRGQQFDEQAYLRSLPLNELNALRSGTQVQNPSFSATPQANVANTNTSGDIWSAYNANQANASNQTAQNNGMTSGLMSLAGTAAAVF